jgi:hypothetical protein
MATARQDAYQKACDIADLLLSRGYPVVSYEAVDDGHIVIRFGGPRAQQIHAEADQASFEGMAAAYDRAPPPPEAA